MAMDHPDVMFSQAPLEILEAAAFEGETTNFMAEYFALGHSQWVAEKHGRSIHLPEDQMNQAILGLWLRACSLNTDHLLDQETTLINPI